jgi:hypothetical protein
MALKTTVVTISRLEADLALRSSSAPLDTRGYPLLFLVKSAGRGGTPDPASPGRIECDDALRTVNAAPVPKPARARPGAAIRAAPERVNPAALSTAGLPASKWRMKSLFRINLTNKLPLDRWQQ